MWNVAWDYVEYRLREKEYRAECRMQEVECMREEHQVLLSRMSLDEIRKYSKYENVSCRDVGFGDTSLECGFRED